jgi:hypothetical protein
VIGHTVYTSSFKTGDAIGIDVRSHHKTFHMSHLTGTTKLPLRPASGFRCR